ncbi:hypothetical protein CARUB_v10021696mg [Capsella rubella]|uniref:F-box domain-containing protein n=1 Tax=Capsella rubella TaxID=81985 RepID=R0GEW1_9BRAS|nr:putative F-box protein At1g70970 [Capsella rubella]EOA34186.1 hypothetical protein CARUB_v10021696mg [Capsella rubella]
MENSSFDTVFSLDLQKHIMSFFTLKSLAKCICVSKQWASLIRGEDFAKVYLNRSIDRPRLMFMVGRFASDPPEPQMSWFYNVYKELKRAPGKYDVETEALFHSVYQKEEPLLLSGQQQLRIPFEPFTCSVTRPIQGLIYLQLRTKSAICNPGAKTFRTLPEIKADPKTVIKSFLGYDKATDVFKVLCITCRSGVFVNPIRTYQVCTIRFNAGEESWRPIRCAYDHSPSTEGLFIDGVLYYEAERYSDKARVIMSFNVMSEEFSVIELSEQVRSDNSWHLVNYNEKIALPQPVDNKSRGLQMWVRDEMGVWSLRSIRIPPWKKAIGCKRLYFRGNIHGTNELVFTENGCLGHLIPSVIHVLLYNTEKPNLIRKIDVEKLDGDNAETFVDHVDSTWLM